MSFVGCCVAVVRCVLVVVRACSLSFVSFRCCSLFVVRSCSLVDGCCLLFVVGWCCLFLLFAMYSLSSLLFVVS